MSNQTMVSQMNPYRQPSSQHPREIHKSWSRDKPADNIPYDLPTITTAQRMSVGSARRNDITVYVVPTLVRDWTGSLHSRHFLTRGEHSEQVATCPQGPNRVSRFVSEQTIQSSNDSCSDWTRFPTPALAPLWETNSLIVLRNLRVVGFVLPHYRFRDDLPSPSLDWCRTHLNTN